MVSLGSSLDEQGIDANATSIGNSVRGVMTWLNIISHQRFRYDVWYDSQDPQGRTFSGDCCAKSSQPSWEIKKYAKRAVERNPDIALIQNGTNEMATAGMTVNRIMNNSRAIYEHFLERGIPILIGPEPVRGTTQWDATSRALRHELKYARQKYASENSGVIYYDPDKYMVDLTNANSFPLAKMLRDDTHYWNAAYYIAKSIYEALSPYLPIISPNILSFGQADAYDITTNPEGILQPNPHFNGTGGGAAATNVTGVFADSYRAAYSGTIQSSCVVSKVATRRDGRIGSAQKLTFSTTGAAGDNLINFRNLPSGGTEQIINKGLQAGDWVQFSARMILGKWAGWGGLTLNLQELNSGGNSINNAYDCNTYNFESEDVNGNLGRKMSLPTEEIYGTWKTQPLRLRSSTVDADGFRARIQAYIINETSTASADPSIIIEEWAVRKIADPRIPKEGR